MPYRELPTFFASLPDTVPAMALRFLILTACRSGEALGCKWSEIDFRCSYMDHWREPYEGGPRARDPA